MTDEAPDSFTDESEIALTEDLAPPAEAETPEVETAEAAPEPETDDESSKRMARLAHDAREARRRTRSLEAEIAVLRGQRTEAPDEELARKVESRAAEIAAQTAFNARCNTINEQGLKEFPSWRQAIADLNETCGGLPTNLIEASEDAGEPVKLLHYLGENTDELERIIGLPAHRMGVELAKLANKLTAKPVKAVSRAPSPIKPLTGSSSAADEKDPEKMTMAEYARYEDQRMRDRYH